MSNKLILPQNSSAIKQLVDEAYLDIGDTTKLAIRDYITYPDEEFIDNPYLDILNIWRNPDNFYYTCKYILNIELHPFQLLIIQELWKRKFPMLIATRGGSKSYLLAVYCILRALFHQGCKVILVGSAFRQSKILFDYMENIWSRSPILQSIVGKDRREGPRRDIDRCTFFIGESEVIAIPVGSGEKIRGLRGNYIITDEFKSIDREIFEIVIRGFGAVTASPVESVKKQASIEALKKLGIYTEEMGEMDSEMGNQIVISGTAYYAFNHFYEYWKKYKTIIESGGKQDVLEDVFQGAIPRGFDWRDYSIVRLPHTSLPYGFLDDVQIAQARALSHSAVYFIEFCTIFVTDSNGFFKRSVIEKCTCKEPIKLPSGDVQFEAAVRGNPNGKYIIAVDPASESDNFAIIVIELHPDHRRIVYSWTTTRQKLRDRLKKTGDTKSTEQGFYSYCARKIRDLLRVFPCSHIGIDAQGGGIGIIEALHDNALLEPGELPIWPYIKEGDNDVFWWEEKNKPTDGLVGLHILHAIQFGNFRFTSEANHGLRQDLENRVLLFPRFDSVSIGLSIEDDKVCGREYDTLEDAVVEIEELKDELATITHTQTNTGKDKWDTPETKVGILSKKGRLRKDRYSALVIGNYIARLTNLSQDTPEYHCVGGYVGKSRSKEAASGQLYVGPQHIIGKMSNIGGVGILRK